MIRNIHSNFNQLALHNGSQIRLTTRPVQKRFGARLRYHENSRKQKVTEGNRENKTKIGETNLETYGNRLN